MVTIKVRFATSMKGKLPMGTFDALRNEITKRLSPKYPDLNIDISWGSFLLMVLARTKRKPTLKKHWKKYGMMGIGCLR